MSYRFHHTCSLLLLSGRYELSKVARVTHKWRRICTRIAQGRSDKQSDQNLFLGGEKGLMLTFTRHQQTLPSDFGVHLPSIKQIENFLSSRKVQFEHGHTSLIASCPFCPENSDATQKLKPKTLYINKTTGSHFCKNCGVSGTWQKFKISCLENQGKSSSGSLSLKSHSDNICDHDHVSQIWNASTPINECPDDVWQKFITFFKIKELRKDILTKFEVRFTEREFVDAKGKSKKHKCVVFPWYDVNNSTVRGVKLVKLDADVSDSSFTIEPRQGFLGLFGWNTVDSEAKEVVLVSTEFDAMAVSQSTSYPSVSLPLGTNSLPPEVLPQLEQFEKIFLWFGNDVFSRQAVNQFSRKLNLNRCFLVRPTGDNTPSNALDALNSGHDLTALVSAAQPTSHEKITTFHQLRSDVYDQFVNADQVAGVKWTRFPKLSSILKGFRRGEVTVFTGPTGAGKTTLLSEMSLDLCLQGVNTLWGSFEIRNVRLVKMMLCQYSGLNLENKVEQFQYWADKFEMLPMYFMCFYGAQNINTVVETMSHAAYVYDIDHVIVDNLQFMTSYLSRGDDRFSAQNHVIAALRNFATSKNVHVTLVIHPRKENEEVELQTASIFGSAKASQEADNVIILQSKKGSAQKYLQVTKNRFDGVLGRVPLDFVKESLSMSGFGKVLQPNRPTNVDKSGNEKFKPTRLTGDVSDVKFSAPRMFGSYKPFDRNARILQPSTKKEIFDNNATTDNPASSSDSKRQMESETDGETTNKGKMADEFDVGISQEKKENVQRTVKKILSGTRLITKAVSGPRSYNNIRAKSPTDRKQNTS